MNERTVSNDHVINLSVVEANKKLVRLWTKAVSQLGVLCGRCRWKSVIDVVSADVVQSGDDTWRLAPHYVISQSPRRQLHYRMLHAAHC